jgi:hypothetical protein
MGQSQKLDASEIADCTEGVGPGLHDKVIRSKLSCPRVPESDGDTSLANSL